MIGFSAIPNRTMLARIYYGVVIVFLLYHLHSQVLLSQLQLPVLNFVGTDLSYIALFCTGLSRFIVSHYAVALAFDISLFTVSIAAFLFPGRRYLPAAFTLLLGVYIVIWYTFLCFHKHNLTGVWWCSVMFCIVDEEGFLPLFYLTRLYCLFVYASSGFWKFFRGVWDLRGHFSVIIKNDALSYLVEHPTGWHSKIISFLVIHPGLTDDLMLFSCFAQLSFIIGAFTRRFDWFYFAFALGFHLFSYFLIQANFLEFSILLITLLPLPYLYKDRTATL